MIDSSGRRFIQLMEPHRDALYSRAWALADRSLDAERCVQRGVRAAFREFVAGPQPREFAPWLQAHVDAELAPAAGKSEGPSAAPESGVTAMPADVWARLAALIQIESVKIHGPTEEGDEALLAYDPLLVPKKAASAGDDLPDGLNLSPWSRFVVAAAIALIIGVVAAVVLTTHHAPPQVPGTATQPTAAH